MPHYDLVILGAGSGNNLVGDEVSHLRVAIVEKGPWGGTCLNRGCIPSKMLVLPADHAHDAADGHRHQLETSYDGVDWAGLRGRIFGRTDEVSADGRDDRRSREHVDTYEGVARFVGPRRLVVVLDDGQEVEVSGDQVVIATGSRPVVPDIPGLREAQPHTSDTIMRIDELPRRLGVIGGGYVGSELAHVFSALGVEVVQVESSHTLLDGQDAEVSRVFTALASQQWGVRLGTRLEAVQARADGTHLELSDGTTTVVDELLVAIGRTTNADLLGLDYAQVRERSGIEVDDDGRVVVDGQQRTTAPGVWALGDASSHHPLKHVANREARTVLHNLLHPDDLVSTDHTFVPQAVFSSPQVASVGMTEEDAREQGIDLAVGTAPFSGTAYGWATNDEAAGWFCKVLADRATGRLVGAHLVGPQSATLVQPLIQAMVFGLPAADLARTPFWIHPAPTEVVESALLELAQALQTR